MTVKLTRWALAAGVLLSLALVPAAQPTAPFGTGILLLGAGVLLCYGLASRVMGDQPLAWLAVGALGVRAALAVLFFWISAAGLPIAEHLQLGDGFWTFAPDARHHDFYARRILELWGDGIPDGLDRGWYFLLLAGIYQFAGVHPLHGSIVNAIAGGLSPLVAFAIAARFGGPRAGRVSAAVVAFWPSLLLWSTQLLKEEITILLVLAALYSAVALCDSFARVVAGDTAPPRSRVLPLLALAAVSTALVAIGRPFYALTLAASVFAVMAAASAVALSRRRILVASRALAAGLVIIGSALVGEVFDPLYALAPPAPWVGHYALGVRFLEQGDIPEARRRFAQALEVNPGYTRARETLARLTPPEPPGAPAAAAPPVALAALEPAWTPSPAAQRSTAPPPADTSAAAPVLPPAPAAAPATPSVPPAERPSRFAVLLRSSVDRGVQLGETVRNLPATFSSLREGQATAIGNSPIDADVTFTSLGDMLVYLPKGVVYFFLAPFPWEAFRTTGVSGGLKMLSLLEMLLTYALLPFAVVSGGRLLRRRHPGACMLCLYLLFGSVTLGLTMPGLGNLFRYRTPFLLVVMLFGSVGLSMWWARRQPAPAVHVPSATTV